MKKASKLVATKERTYGELWFKDGEWHLRCEPHVIMMAKRIFQRIPVGQHGVLKISDTPETCRMLEWFVQMYPLRITNATKLFQSAYEHVQNIARLADLIDPNYKPREFALALQPRTYQRQAAEVYLAAGSLLLADDVGLGKTCSAICSLTDAGTLPALVVCPAHLTRQWQKEINRFAPKLVTHILKKAEAYELPKVRGRGPDVIIASYHKMRGWAEVLAAYVKSTVFDEGQELRRNESAKYGACRHVARAAKFRIALTATPIYNYGGEIYNLIDILRPGVLGTWDEFSREWCNSGERDKASLKDPTAFGAWMKEQSLMLRRTRRDVRRELPKLSRITMPCDTDPKALNQIEDAAHELAKIVLAEHGAGIDKMKAAAELEMLARRATGIAKAPHVADFVETLLESGEPVVLFGWHRLVYDLWQSKLSKYSPAMFTGSESPSRKQAEVARFVEGQTNLIFVSLRSGAGLDGLQHRCRTVVIGELDWSPGVHEQCIGRIFRDGQPDPVTVYFMLADDGSDPMVAEIVGLKRQQIDGLRESVRGDIEQVAPAEGIRKIADAYLHRKKRRK